MWLNFKSTLSYILIYSAGHFHQVSLKQSHNVKTLCVCTIHIRTSHENLCTLAYMYICVYVSRKFKIIGKGRVKLYVLAPKMHHRHRRHTLSKVHQSISCGSDTRSNGKFTYGVGGFRHCWLYPTLFCAGNVRATVYNVANNFSTATTISIFIFKCREMYTTIRTRA